MSENFQLNWQLFLAARTGDLEAARACLKKGANPNFEEPPNKNSRPGQNRTLLARAVSFGHLELVELLFDSGATLPNDESQQEQLTYSARCSNCPEMLKILLSRGITPSRDDADWALEEGYKELYEMIIEVLGTYKIDYDIDALLEKEIHSFYNEFCRAIPEHFSIHDPMLLPEERVIRDLWELTCSTGSGFTAMISNEGFDTVERSLNALSTLGDSVGLQAVSELKATLVRYGFTSEPDSIAQNLEALGEDQWEKLDVEIEILDRKYFHGEELSLWDTPDYLELGREYAFQHIENLRKRKVLNR